MNLPPSRTAELVLISPSGEGIGRVPRFPDETAWWADVEPVVRGVRERHGIEVTILRLIESEHLRWPGGDVTYLAETTVPRASIGGLTPVDARTVDRLVADQPLRQRWARPGGPAADIAWADGRLAGLGLERTGPASQVKTWNLSSLWTLPVGARRVWLKTVPPFFGHEGGILDRLRGGRVPTLLAYADRRLLLDEIPGEDRFDAAASELVRMVELLMALQVGSIGRLDELFELGAPDWRGPALAAAIGATVDRDSAVLSPADRSLLASFVGGLAARFAAIEAAGLPATLVHGDFHPGNLRGDGTSLVLLDWGDCGVGHPLLDRAAFFERVAPDVAAEVSRTWHAAWRTAIPGSDPDRASRLLAPVAAARQAVIYRGFLDHIEPDEHPYHANDPHAWLGRTAALVRAEGRSDTILRG